MNGRRPPEGGGTTGEIHRGTDLQAPAAGWPALGGAGVPAPWPLHGWLQPMRDAPSLPCGVFTAGMWEFLQGPGLWTDVGPGGPSLAEGPWRAGASGEKGAWAAEPEDDVTWPCCPELSLGGRREERPVGLLGGTDRSVCGWWSPGWKASPGEQKHRQSSSVFRLSSLSRNTQRQNRFTFIKERLFLHKSQPVNDNPSSTKGGPTGEDSHTTSIRTDQTDV